MKFPRKPREQVDINLAPLIDVVFILLLFFVVTTTFTRETRIKVDLPQAVSGQSQQEAEPRTLEVMVSVDGSYAVNDVPLAKNDLQSLMQALQELSAGDLNYPITISADGKAPHQSVVTAMDAAAKLGFARLRISTVEAEENQ